MITLANGTKVKVSGTYVFMGRKIHVTKLGILVEKLSGPYASPAVFETKEAAEDAICEVERKTNEAESLSYLRWEHKATIARQGDGETSRTAYSQLEAQAVSRLWGTADRDPINFGQEGGVLIAVKVGADGRPARLLTLDMWANVYFFVLPEGYRFLN